MRKYWLNSFVMLLAAILLMPLGVMAQSYDPFNIGQAFINPSVLSSDAERQKAAAETKAAEAMRAQQAATASSTVPQIAPQPPQFFDYSANIKSDVFGANLFTGAFARQGATQFNPDYVLAIGDSIQIRLWGAFVYEGSLTVDPKGNIFIPYAGPVLVLGVRNQDLQGLVEAAVSKVFRANVYCYASLAAAQPVRVFVSGFVNRPGLYNGTSMDSLLHYLDQAGGIDLERGSFLHVQVKRGQMIRATVNLYDFLLKGSIPQVQLVDGDVIFVSSRQHTVKVSGLAENAKRFEFSQLSDKLSDLVRVAKPMATATHVRVVRNTGTIKNVEYYPLADARKVILQNGDEVEFAADKKPGTISVRVEGEHLSPQEYVLPYGTRMAELMHNIQFSERSDTESLQLFRLSVKERQKQMLQTSLKRLESVALMAPSGTNEEAQLRKAESELILQWVEKAKEIEPNGQVIIAQAAQSGNDLLLENGDIIRVPVKDGLVLISGEVLFPNSVAYDKDYDIDDYIRLAGGYTQNVDASRIIVAHRDGNFDEGSGNTGLFSFDEDVAIKPGDEIMVLPKVDVKSRQIWKEVTQMIYQVALAARVVTRF